MQLRLCRLEGPGEREAGLQAGDLGLLRSLRLSPLHWTAPLLVLRPLTSVP